MALVVPARARAAFEPLAARAAVEVILVEQPEPRGYAHALYQARHGTGDEPFLHLVGDHFYLPDSGTSQGLAETLVSLYQEHKCSVSGRAADA